MTRLIYGIGVNDADYITQPIINGKQKACPFYRTWFSMMSRCYSKKLHEKQPMYIGCTVCKEWLSFMAFREWMQVQNWEGKQLDKDILASGNKIYSPSTCLFVSSQINKLFCDSAAIRGSCPQGVCKVDNRYKAYVNKYGKRQNIGYFNTIKEAEYAYLIAKSIHVIDIANEQEICILKYALIDKAEKMMKQAQELI